MQVKVMCTGMQQYWVINMLRTEYSVHTSMVRLAPHDPEPEVAHAGLDKVVQIFCTTNPRHEKRRIATQRESTVTANARRVHTVSW